MLSVTSRAAGGRDNCRRRTVTAATAGAAAAAARWLLQAHTPRDIILCARHIVVAGVDVVDGQRFLLLKHTRGRPGGRRVHITSYIMYVCVYECVRVCAQHRQLHQRQQRQPLSSRRHRRRQPKITDIIQRYCLVSDALAMVLRIAPHRTAPRTQQSILSTHKTCVDTRRLMDDVVDGAAGVLVCVCVVLN